jgi:glycogen synthase
VGLRFNGGDAEHLGVMIERLLVDAALRERLVVEASEHVLRFDWDDIAQRTAGIYDALTRPGRPRTGAEGPSRRGRKERAGRG